MKNDRDSGSNRKYAGRTLRRLGGFPISSDYPAGLTLTVTTFDGLQSNVAGFFGYTRTNFPPLTCRRAKQLPKTLPPTSVGPRIPSAVNLWIVLAAAMKLARVRPLTPLFATTCFTASRKNRAGTQASTPKEAAFDRPPTALM